MDFLLLPLFHYFFIYFLSRSPVATGPLITRKKQHLERLLMKPRTHLGGLPWRPYVGAALLCVCRRGKREKKTSGKNKTRPPPAPLWVDTVPDGSLVCEKYSTNKKQYAVRWDALVWGPYLPDRRSAPPPPAYAKVCWMTPVSHSLSHSLALLHRCAHTHTHRYMKQISIFHFHWFL